MASCTMAIHRTRALRPMRVHRCHPAEDFLLRVYPMESLIVSVPANVSVPRLPAVLCRTLPLQPGLHHNRRENDENLLNGVC